MIGCTTATGTHLAGAEVVATSWRRLHPEGAFYVLQADAARRTHGEPAPFVLFPEDLGLDGAELRVRQGIYDAFEYTASLKPHLLRFLLRDRAGPVIFTDSDTDVYGPLDQLAALARSHAVCLVPHALSPLPPDGMSTHELELLHFGVFNAGLVAVGPSAGPFLDWWAARLRRDCLDSDPDGFVVEQRWANLAPSYFDHVVVRDPTINVAVWNLHERRIAAAAGGFTVNGEPLRHFHFSGFDPSEPGQLYQYPMARPARVRMSDQPSLAALCGDYAERLMAAGYRERTSGGYPFASSATGRRLGRWERVVYREAVLAAEAGAAPAPPGPFDPAEAAAFDRLVDMVDGYQRHLSAPALARLAHARGALDAPRPRGARERIMTRARRLVMSRLGVRSGFLSPSEVVTAEYAEERRPTS